MATNSYRPVHFREIIPPSFMTRPLAEFLAGQIKAFHIALALPSFKAAYYGVVTGHHHPGFHGGSE